MRQAVCIATLDRFVREGFLKTLNSTWLTAFTVRVRLESVFQAFPISTPMARQPEFGSITSAGTRKERNHIESFSVIS